MYLRITDQNSNAQKYLADGTKLEVSDAQGGGYLYFGSLIYHKLGDRYEPESVAFSGGRIVGTSTGSQVQYHVTDYLGSVRVVADAEGKRLEKCDYYPFGKRIEEAEQPTTGNRYLFNGKEWQPTGAVNLLDYGARMYDPNLGRWFCQDPLYQVHNPYTFCSSDPVNRIDPNGMDWYYNSTGGYLGQDDSMTYFIRILDDGVDWKSLCNKWGIAYANKAHAVSSFFTSVKLNDWAVLQIYNHIAQSLGMSYGNFSIGIVGGKPGMLMATQPILSIEVNNGFITLEYINRWINHTQFGVLVEGNIADNLFNIASLFEHEDVHERGWQNDAMSYDQKTKIEREFEAYDIQVHGKFFPQAQPWFQIHIIKLYYKYLSQYNKLEK